MTDQANTESCPCPDELQREVQTVVDESVSHLAVGGSASSGVANLIALITSLVAKFGALIPAETLKAIVGTVFDNTVAKLDWPFVDGVDEASLKLATRAMLLNLIDSLLVPTTQSKVALNSAMAKADELRASLPA